MKAAILTAPGHVDVVDVPVPCPESGHALVRVEQCGLCASEVDLWLGKGASAFPLAIGHEVVGVVEAVGPDVNSVDVGDRIVGLIHQGGFAEFVTIDARYGLRVGRDVRYAAVAEPLSCVVNAVELAAPSLGDDVVIIGGGFMGSLVQLVTALKGPRSITVADVRHDSLQRALSRGATHIVDTSSESLVDVVLEATGGRGADVVYEVTGVNSGLDLATSVTKMAGKLCIVGYHQGGRRSIDLARWNWMAFTIVNAHFRSFSTIMRGMGTGIQLVEAGAIDVASLVTNVYRLNDIGDAFEAAIAKKDGFVKALVEL